MRIFLTGGTGFIGSHVLIQLLERGHDVLLLSRTTKIFEHDGVEILQATLADVNKIEKKLHEWKPEVCLHLAWYTEPRKYLDAPENIDYLIWSLQLLKTVCESGCGKIIVAGTCAEYRFTGNKLSEDDEVFPENIYAASKLSLYHAGLEYTRINKLKFIWGRVFFPYGPKEDSRRAVAALIKSLLKGKKFQASEGKQIRDYLHVEDIASAFITLVETDTQGIVNICSGQPVSLKDLMKKVAEIIKNRGLIEFGAMPYRKWEPMHICGNNSKLKSLGWEQKYQLCDGLKSTIAWWKRQNRD